MYAPTRLEAWEQAGAITRSAFIESFAKSFDGTLPSESATVLKTCSAPWLQRAFRKVGMIWRLIMNTRSGRKVAWPFGQGSSLRALSPWMHLQRPHFQTFFLGICHMLDISEAKISQKRIGECSEVSIFPCGRGLLIVMTYLNIVARELATGI